MRSLPTRFLKPLTLTSTAGRLAPALQAAASGPSAARAGKAEAPKAAAKAAAERKILDIAAQTPGRLRVPLNRRPRAIDGPPSPPLFAQGCGQIMVKARLNRHDCGSRESRLCTLSQAVYPC